MNGEAKKSLKKLICAGISILFITASAKATLVNSNSIVQDGIEYYIQTDNAVYNLGEDVEMLYRITNLTDEEVLIGCSRSGEFDLWVQKDGQTIWALAHWFTWFSPGVELSAGELQEISHNWDMKDDDGVLVEPGIYNVVGVMYNEPWNYYNNRGYTITEVGVPITIIPEPATRTIYVDADAPAANDGSSWTDAYNYLQDALADANSAAKPIEIRVAQGIYKPDEGIGITPGDREATFQLTNGVSLMGGFAGFGEPDPNARDINAYETILSGDLDGNDIDVNDLYDLLDEPTRAENSHHVVTASGTNETAVLDGFTITAGNANVCDVQHGFGAGIYNNSSSPTMANCTFSRNAASLGGGGMYNVNSSPTLTNCMFGGNSAKQWGGGMYSGGVSSPTLSNCTFSDNQGYRGGGMYSTGGQLTLTTCTFNRNTAYHGGGIENITSSLMLKNCIFSGNSAVECGGGLHDYESSMTITNCVFSGNSASGRHIGGGGICFEDSSLSITNTTFSGNLAVKHGGGIYCPFPPMPSAALSGSSAGLAAGPFTINSCILWGNSDSGGEDESAQLDVYIPPVVNYSCIQGWTGALGGIGSIGDDPCFMAPGYWDANGAWVDSDYHLLAGSPCIDAGDPNYVPEPNETDLDGKPRIINGRIDMGAYEYMPSIPAEVDIEPDTLNLTSKGKWITAFIRLTEDYDVDDIEPNSVFLEEQIKAEQLLVNEQEQVAIAKFSREEVQAILNTGDIELTITGWLKDGTRFEGKDTIKIIDNNVKKKGRR